ADRRGRLVERSRLPAEAARAALTGSPPYPELGVGREHEAIAFEVGGILGGELPVDVGQAIGVERGAGLDRAAHGDDADAHDGALELTVEAQCEVELGSLADAQRGRHRLR